MDEIVKEFLVESYENLGQTEQDLVQLEQSPARKQLLDRIFRCIHTVKGTCGYLGFKKLEKLSHTGESLLSRLRDGKLAATPEVTNVLLGLVDGVKDILGQIEKTGQEGEKDYSALIEGLTRARNGAPIAAMAEPHSGNAKLMPSQPGQPENPSIQPKASAPAERIPELQSEAEETLSVVVPTEEPSEVEVLEILEEAPDDRLLKGFLAETKEKLAHLEIGLLELGKGPSARKVHTQLFRSIHSVQVSAGLLALKSLESLSQAFEEVLRALRDGKMSFNSAVAKTLHAGLESMYDLVVELQDSGQEMGDHSTALAAMRTLLERNETPAAAKEPKITSAAKQAASPLTLDRESVPAAEGREKTAAGAETVARQAAISDTAIRVDVRLLDQLMNQVGELVLARNQILQRIATLEDTRMLDAAHSLSRITTELQEGIMKTRMQPIANVWNPFPRMARDLARNSGKRISVRMEGSETELDKSLIESIKDPLIHLVRNSIDHGIETPEKRVAMGKPPEGSLMLWAYHKEGQVIIEISDDGAGIDPDRVKRKAIEKGLVTPLGAEGMSERDLLNLIFVPGFSTADKITNVSGRGVGMDVVKSNIERIGGTVDVQSKVGQGTTVKIRIPLTLAIIPALIVASGGERFAIPQVGLVELLRLEGEAARKSIEKIHGAPVYRLRGELIPLVHLNRELGLGNGASGTSSADGNGEAVNIIVLQADVQNFGLVVDHVNDTQEIVVKPLSSLLRNLPVYAGTTILGDGRVALILDVPGFAQRVHVVAKAHARAGTQERESVERQEQRLSVLIFEMGGRERMVIPLSEVTRLESFPRSAIERSGNQDVVQYRGEILPLYDVSKALNGHHPVQAEPGICEKDGEIQVVVCGNQGRHAGLVVDRIIDIVEEPVRVKGGASREGVVERVVVQGRVGELLDVGGILRKVEPSWDRSKSLVNESEGRNG